MNRYVYNGPVESFDKPIADQWYGETLASSEKKAKSNLTYQFKKCNNLLPTAKISLPGEIKIIE